MSCRSVGELVLFAARIQISAAPESHTYSQGIFRPTGNTITSHQQFYLIHNTEKTTAAKLFADSSTEKECNTYFIYLLFILEQFGNVKF